MTHHQLTFFLLLCWPWLLNCTALNRQLTIDEWNAVRPQRTLIADRKFAETDSIASHFNYGRGLADSLSIEKALDLGKRYSALQLDSALRYFSVARRMAESAGMTAKENLANAHYLSLLPLKNSTGADMLDRFNTIDATQFSDIKDLEEYYICAYQLFYRLNQYTPLQSMKDASEELMRKTGAELTALLGDGDPISHMIKGIDYDRDGKPRLAIASYLTALDNCNNNREIYYNACLLLTQSYQNNQNPESALQYALRSAISEIEMGIMSGLGMMRLSDILLTTGKIPEAYDGLQDALDNTMRAGNISGSVDASDRYYRLNKVYGTYYLDRQRAIIAIMLILLLLITIDISIRIIGSRKRAKREMLQTQEDVSNVATTENDAEGSILALSNGTRQVESKEEFTNHQGVRWLTKYIDFYADYLNSIEEFRSQSRRKISSGQTYDVLQQLKSHDPIAHNPDRFLANFDLAFLELFPDFVDELNTIMQPDKRIELSDPSHLTNELRICAFMRMGVDDSASIARLLNVTVTTVYTYRNKIRQRAIDREELVKIIRGDKNN